MCSLFLFGKTFWNLFWFLFWNLRSQALTPASRLFLYLWVLRDHSQ